MKSLRKGITCITKSNRKETSHYNYMSLTKYKKRHYGSENYIYSLQTIHVLILQYDSTNHNSIRNNFICVGPVNGDAIAINDNISV